MFALIIPTELPQTKLTTPRGEVHAERDPVDVGGGPLNALLRLFEYFYLIKNECRVVSLPSCHTAPSVLLGNIAPRCSHVRLMTPTCHAVVVNLQGKTKEATTDGSQL